MFLKIVNSEDFVEKKLNIYLIFLIFSQTLIILFFICFTLSKSISSNYFFVYEFKNI